MRTLIYKRTHEGDPCPATGVFGNHNCMRTVRKWSFDAVIGIGGIGRKAKSAGIACKLTWIGIGPNELRKRNNPPNMMTFDHFLYYGQEGPLLKKVAPALARRMYNKKVRVLMDSLSKKQRQDVERILDLAKDAPPSGQPRDKSQRNSQKTSSKCRSNFSCGTSAGRKANKRIQPTLKEWRG